LTGFVDAVTFLTRIPLRHHADGDVAMARSVPWFGVVGALVGLVVAGVYAGARYLFPPFAAATLATAAGALVTGGFHEDGLGDVADAFGGGKDRDDALRILRDPRLGTFGILAVVTAVLLRIGTISTLTRIDALLAIPAAHALSRAASVAAMGSSPPVRDGLGASYTRALTSSRVAVGALVGTAIAAVLLRSWVLPAIVVAAGVTVVMRALARRKIGGINGDVLGAIQQLTEVGVLLTVVAALARGHALH
jgi:adenosylcobinamide-GDP ribazoletransferase